MIYYREFEVFDEGLDALIKELVDKNIGLESSEGGAFMRRGEPTIWVNLNKAHPWNTARKSASPEAMRGMEMANQETAHDIIEELGLAGYGDWEIDTLSDLKFTLVKAGA